MSPKRIKNIAASVRQRLLNYAREREEEFGLVLSRYAAERFLYRLTQSEHRERFVLKGALLFLVWEGELHRVTRDVDLLGYGAAAIADLEQAVRDICGTEVPEDGMRFLADTIHGTRIREDQEYEGLVDSYRFVGDADDVSGNINHGMVEGATLTTDCFAKAAGAFTFSSWGIGGPSVDQFLDIPPTMSNSSRGTIRA